VSFANGEPCRLHRPRLRPEVGMQPEQPLEEIKRLQRCISDLVSVLALPVIWSGGDPSQVARTLLDALQAMLRLDFIYVRLNDLFGGEPVELVRFAQTQNLTARPQEILRALKQHWGPDPQKWAPLVRHPVGDGDVSIVAFQLGLQGEIGIIVAGAQRADFPGQTERLLLSVAANQASIGLQEAQLLSNQKRLANELDQRVAQRTRELAVANEALLKEIAERKLVEERLWGEERELRRSEAFLAEGQRLSSTGSFSWRLDTDVITWSEELYRIYEISQGALVTLELIGTRVHPDDIPSFNDMIAWARSAGSHFEYDHRLQMPDHSVKYLHMVAHATRDQDDRLEYIGAIQDVTQRRLSDEALGKARSELAHVARVTTLGALTASIAHEVNQPLSGIITNASTGLRMLGATPPDVEGALETVRRTLRDGKRAADVIVRLRALFGKKNFTGESVDLNEATREVIALSLSEFQRSRVVLRTEFADDLPPVTGDRVQLQQVILNLFLNASDAMSGVDDRPRELLIRTELDQGDQVRVSVQDAGTGFEPKNAEKLFDAFYTTKSAGMGIGLSVSRSIIEGHHGRLWASSNDGSGATFSFSIPRGTDAVAGVHSLDGIRTSAAMEAKHNI
jgi:signal transduction histidine kinase